MDVRATRPRQVCSLAKCLKRLFRDRHYWLMPCWKSTSEPSLEVEYGVLLMSVRVC